MYLCKHPLIREFPEMVSTFAHIVQTQAKNTTSSEMCSVTGVQYATEHDVTVVQVSAHQSSKINSVLFGLPATCRSFTLIYPPSRFSLSFCFIQTSPKHCRWTITDSAQMTSEIALFPLPCTHMSQMLFGWEWLRAKIKRNVPLAIELTARRSALLPLFIFCQRVWNEKRFCFFCIRVLVLFWTEHDTL